MLASGSLERLPEASQAAADQAYTATVNKLAEGLRGVLTAYESSPDEGKKRIASLWRECGGK